MTAAVGPRLPARERTWQGVGTPADQPGGSQSGTTDAREHGTHSAVGVRAEGIVWIASYPKSGNTWTQTLLANFLSDSHEPVAFDKMLEVVPFASASDRMGFDYHVGLESSDYTDDENEAWRPAWYRAVAEQAKPNGRRLFYKVHDACHGTSVGEPLFPSDATAAAVYLVRNPLDIAVSWAFYADYDNFDIVVQQLADREGCIRSPRQLRQRLLDWSGHFESWTGAPFPVIVVRYEDMLADTLGQFKRIVRFLGLEGASDEGRLRRAVSFAEFGRLQEYERKNEHRFGLPQTRQFFRFGTAGQWRSHLTPEQVKAVVAAHGPAMKKLGYWE